MLIANSQLFKTYARPVLQDPPPDSTATISEAPGIMDSIIQYFINRSRLDVSLVRITEATEEFVNTCQEERGRTSF